MSDTLAGKIVSAMERRGARVDRNPGEVNIVYVEGMDGSGVPNTNRPNAFDDLRCVIRFEGGAPVIAGLWEATTQSGERYTQDPVNDKGAAIIALGQQSAWQVGMHRGNHEALIQTGGEVTVYRDADKNYKREGDDTDSGFFGINQHWGYDQSKDNIGSASAGCLVGRSEDGHREFMAIVKSDPRYVANSQFVFPTTVLTAVDVLREQPATQTGFRSLTGGYFADGSDSALPASIRFNNPGAINSVPWIQALPGYAGERVIGGGNHIAIFFAPEYGVAAWWKLMERYANAGATTVGGIVDKYGGGQDYSGYIRFVAAKSGLSAASPISLDDVPMLLAFAKAMFWYEAGRATPLSDDQIRYGFAFARDGVKPPTPPPITPEPVDVDPPDLGAIRRELADQRAMLENIMNQQLQPQPQFTQEFFDRLAASMRAIQPPPPPPAPTTSPLDGLKPLLSKTNLGIGGVVATILGSLYTKTPLDSDFIVTLLTLFAGLGGIGIGDKMRKANDATKQVTATLDKVLANLPKQ